MTGLFEVAPPAAVKGVEAAWDELSRLPEHAISRPLERNEVDCCVRPLKDEGRSVSLHGEEGAADHLFTGAQFVEGARPSVEPLRRVREQSPRPVPSHRRDDERLEIREVQHHVRIRCWKECAKRRAETFVRRLVAAGRDVLERDLRQCVRLGREHSAVQPLVRAKN